MQTKTNNIMPDKNGFYGIYGGQYIPDDLKEEYKKIEKAFFEIKDDKDFNDELNYLLKNYVGRPSPIYFAKNLSKKYGNNIYLKREDLNHTGAHKINHSLGEALLAKKMGKTKIMAETGAGQHGVAIATAAALVGLECDIYMGENDIKKEKPNVDRMRILGARIVSVSSCSKTLKEAVDAAFEAYAKEFETTFYAIGSAVGPYPFPMLIEHFQSIIGKESKSQMQEQAGKLPDCVMACVGGGSNSIGMFGAFLDDKDVEIYGVEPMGRGEGVGNNAASMTFGKTGVLHGFKCNLLQDENGNVTDAYSIASGLDYPGVGPKHCYLNSIGRVKYDTVTDEEAVNAFYELSRLEGIIPALESSHAVAYAIKLSQKVQGKDFLVSLSGRGDKDIEFVMTKYPRE